MRYILILIAIFNFVSYKVFSQDTATAYLYFKSEKISLWRELGNERKVVVDSCANDTIVDVGGSKFFYLRRSAKDSMLIESGQLGLYTVNHKLYLLREGFWLVEDSEEKILFKNSGDSGLLIDEEIISSAPVWYDGGSQKKKKVKEIRIAK